MKFDFFYFVAAPFSVAASLAGPANVANEFHEMSKTMRLGNI